MAGAMCIKVVGSSQKVCCPIHPGKQAAASSRKQQQAAASKQQPAFAPCKEWTNKDQRDTKNWTFSRRTALKQWNRSIAKSCDDAKLELFPGARPPDTTLTSWHDLIINPSACSQLIAQNDWSPDELANQWIGRLNRRTDATMNRSKVTYLTNSAIRYYDCINRVS